MNASKLAEFLCVVTVFKNLICNELVSFNSNSECQENFDIFL